MTNPTTFTCPACLKIVTEQKENYRPCDWCEKCSQNYDDWVLQTPEE